MKVNLAPPALTSPLCLWDKITAPVRGVPYSDRVLPLLKKVNLDEGPLTASLDEPPADLGGADPDEADADEADFETDAEATGVAAIEVHAPGAPPLSGTYVYKLCLASYLILAAFAACNYTGTGHLYQR
jgi:hypothetical protein